MNAALEHHGVDSSQPHLVPNRPGGLATDFPIDAGAWAKLPHTAGYNPPGRFSIDLWVRLHNAAKSHVVRSNGASPEVGYSLELTANGKFVFSVHPPVAPSDPIQCHLCVVVRTWLCQSPSLPHACGAGLFADRPRRYGLCRGVVSDNGRLVASRGRDLRRNEAGITRSSPVLQFRRAHCVHACILHWHSRARRAARSITEKAQRL